MPRGARTDTATRPSVASVFKARRKRAKFILIFGSPLGGILAGGPRDGTFELCVLAVAGESSSSTGGPAMGLPPVLLVAAEDTSLESFERLEHEFALKAELNAAWAARPVALSRQDDRMALVLEDPGGEPLDRLLGRPLAPSRRGEAELFNKQPIRRLGEDEGFLLPT
jgi:hypothetical protein